MRDGPKRSQAGKALVRARVEELLRVILDGAEEHWDACEFVRDREKEAGSPWEVKEGEKPLSESQIRRYVAKADALIADSCRASRKKLVRRHLARRRNLYAKAVAQGDVRAALAVLRDEAELLGLYAPRKIAPTNPQGDKPYEGCLSDAERLAALAALCARVGPGGGAAAADGADDAGGPVLDDAGPADAPGGA
jgi:hypothetical protein